MTNQFAYWFDLQQVHRLITGTVDIHFHCVIVLIDTQYPNTGAIVCPSLIEGQVMMVA